MYTLYSMSGSCSTAIHMLLNHLDVPFDIKFHTDVDNYLDINPTGQVPALQTEQGILTEGAAIALFLIDKHKIALPIAKIEFTKWLMFNYASLHPAYSKMFSVQFQMQDGDEKQAYMTLLANKAAELWKIVDARLATQNFMGGDQVSILDYLITIYAGWGNVFPQVSIPLGENVIRIIKHVTALPEFIAAAEKEKMNYTIPQMAA